MTDFFTPGSRDEIVPICKNNGGKVEYANLWRSLIVNPENGTPTFKMQPESCEDRCLVYLGFDENIKPITYCSQCQYFEKGHHLEA